MGTYSWISLEVRTLEDMLLNFQRNRTRFYVLQEAYRWAWARLLKQQLPITVYCFPSKEKKLPFSISVCSKQTEVCRFCFPFAANKRKYPCSASSFFMCMCVCEFLCVYIYLDLLFQIENGKRKPRRFSKIRFPFAHHANRSLSFILSLMEKTNESDLFADGLNGLNGNGPSTPLQLV
jgi:hypothetical protein